MGRQTNNHTNDLRQTSQSSRQLRTHSINTTVNMKYSIAFAVGAALVAAQDISEVPRFGYGLRDCTIEACGEDVFSAVQTYGNSVCAAAGVTSGGAPAAVATTATGAVAGSSVPFTTEAVVTTISSGGSAVATSTIGSTTMYSIAGAVAGGVGSLSGSAS